MFDKLAKLGGPMILQVLEDVENGNLHPVPQNEEEHTYAKMLSKATGQIDFSKPAVQIERLIRGLNPWPSAYCFLDGKMLKIWEADVVTKEAVLADAQEEQPGTIIAINKDSFVIKTGKEYLKVLSVQLEGKKRMDTASFLRGYTVEKGTVLLSERK